MANIGATESEEIKNADPASITPKICSTQTDHYPERGIFLISPENVPRIK